MGASRALFVQPDKRGAIAGTPEFALSSGESGYYDVDHASIDHTHMQVGREYCAIRRAAILQ